MSYAVRFVQVFEISELSLFLLISTYNLKCDHEFLVIMSFLKNLAGFEEFFNPD